MWVGVHGWHVCVGGCVCVCMCVYKLAWVLRVNYVDISTNPLGLSKEVPTCNLPIAGWVSKPPSWCEGFETVEFPLWRLISWVSVLTLLLLFSGGAGGRGQAQLPTEAFWQGRPVTVDRPHQEKPTVVTGPATLWTLRSYLPVLCAVLSCWLFGWGCSFPNTSEQPQCFFVFVGCCFAVCANFVVCKWA